MAKAKLPSWQQVVVQALSAVPDANGGQEAWDKLEPDEQRAITDFAAAHCEGDVQPVLEETRQQIKPHGEWRWLWEGAATVALSVAVLLQLRWMENVLGAWADTAAFFMVLAVILRKLCPDPERVRRFWYKRTAAYDSTLAALEKMHARLNAPDWRGAFIWIGLLAAAALVETLMAV